MNKYALYEQYKHRLQMKNLDPKEYEKALRKIAKRLGI